MYRQFTRLFSQSVKSSLGEEAFALNEEFFTVQLHICDLMKEIAPAEGN